MRLEKQNMCIAYESYEFQKHDKRCGPQESEHETFRIRDENPWVTVEPNGAVRVKKKWDYEELGREKTIDFWVIITNTGTSGELRREEWRFSSPALCSTTTLGLAFCGSFW